MDLFKTRFEFLLFQILITGHLWGACAVNDEHWECHKYNRYKLFFIFDNADNCTYTDNRHTM